MIASMLRKYARKDIAPARLSAYAASLVGSAMETSLALRLDASSDPKYPHLDREGRYFNAYD